MKPVLYSGIDTGGSELGAIESKPEPTGFEDNEEQVQKESYVVKYVSTRDRFNQRLFGRRFNSSKIATTSKLAYSYILTKY
jgi:hypothetical protein